MIVNLYMIVLKNQDLHSNRNVKPLRSYNGLEFLSRSCDWLMIVKRKLKNIQGDPMETQWLLDNHKSPVRSPKRYGQQSAIYQKRNYNGMKKLESFQIRLVGSGIHGPLGLSPVRYF